MVDEYAGVAQSVGLLGRLLYLVEAARSKNPVATTDSDEFDDEFGDIDGYNDEDLDGLDLDGIADVSSIDDIY